MRWLRAAAVSLLLACALDAQVSVPTDIQKLNGILTQGFGIGPSTTVLVVSGGTIEVQSGGTIKADAGSTVTGFAGSVTSLAGTAGQITVTGSGALTLSFDAGGMTVGSPTGGQKGAGTINATGVYVNGVTVGTGGNLSNSGTPTVGQIGVFVDATHIQGLTNLSVPGTLGITGITTLANGTAAAPSAVFAGAGTTGLYWANPGIGFSVAGASVGTWTATGLTVAGSGTLSVGGTSTLTGATTIGNGTGGAYIYVNGGAVGSYAAYINFEAGGASYWSVGRGPADSSANFQIYDTQGTPGTRLSLASGTGAFYVQGTSSLMGNVTVGNGSVSTSIALNSYATSGPQMLFQVSSVNKWQVGHQVSAAGVFEFYSDALSADVLTMNQATGAVVVPYTLAVTGTSTFTGSLQDPSAKWLIAATGQVYIDRASTFSTAANPALWFSTNTDAGLGFYRSAANSLNVAVNGVTAGGWNTTGFTVTGTSTLTGNVTGNGATNTFQSLGSGVGQTLNLVTSYFVGQNATAGIFLGGNVAGGNFAASLSFGNNYTGNQSGAYIAFASGELVFETGGATPGAGTLALTLDASQNATFANDIIIGAPTGGAKGTGTINATAYYINGVAIAGGGNVTGPGSSTVGHLATWSNGAGTSLADGGLAPTALAPESYGATGNTIVLAATGVTINSGSANLAVGNASFVAGDVGKTIIVPGAGISGVVNSTTYYGPLVTTILSRTDGTHVVLNANATTTVTGASENITYGHDDTAAFVSLFSAINSAGGGTMTFTGSKNYLINPAANTNWTQFGTSSSGIPLNFQFNGCTITIATAFTPNDGQVSGAHAYLSVFLIYNCSPVKMGNVNVVGQIMPQADKTGYIFAQFRYICSGVTTEWVNQTGGQACVQVYRNAVGVGNGGDPVTTRCSNLDLLINTNGCYYPLQLQHSGDNCRASIYCVGAFRPAFVFGVKGVRLAVVDQNHNGSLVIAAWNETSVGGWIDDPNTTGIDIDYTCLPATIARSTTGPNILIEADGPNPCHFSNIKIRETVYENPSHAEGPLFAFSKTVNDGSGGPDDTGSRGHTIENLDFSAKVDNAAVSQSDLFSFCDSTSDTGGGGVSDYGNWYGETITNLRVHDLSVPASSANTIGVFHTCMYGELWENINFNASTSQSTAFAQYGVRNPNVSFTNCTIAGTPLAQTVPITYTSGTLNLNWAAGPSFDITMAGSLSGSNLTFSNAVDGQTVLIYVHNTASNYSLSWTGTNVDWGSAGAPTLTNGAHYDVYTITYNATAGKYSGSYVQGF